MLRPTAPTARRTSVHLGKTSAAPGMAWLRSGKDDWAWADRVTVAGAASLAVLSWRCYKLGVLQTGSGPIDSHP